MSERVIHGRWAKFEENGDWRTFFIDIPGKDYPVRVSTKKEDVIAAAMELRDRDATFKVNEQESDKINPKNNLPYINRYLNEVLAGHVGEEGGGTPAVGTPAQKSTGEYQRDPSPESQKRMDQHQLRDLKARAWEITAALAGTPLTGGAQLEGAAAQRQLYGSLKFFQAIVLSDIAGDLLADAPFGDEPDVPFD